MLLSHSKLENNGGERFHCKGEVNDFLFTLIRIPPPPLTARSPEAYDCSTSAWRVSWVFLNWVVTPILTFIISSGLSGDFMHRPS